MGIQTRLANEYDIDSCAEHLNFLPMVSMLPLDACIMMSIEESARRIYYAAHDADDAEMALRTRGALCGMTPDNLTLIGE